MIGLASRPFVAVALVAISCVGLAFSGCGDSGSTTDDPPDECVGGVIVDGKCEGKCEDSKCLENNVCVGNRCMLQCTDHDQCFSPAKGDPTLQECAPQQRDTEAGLNDGDAVLVCTNTVKPLRIGLGCPFATECEAADDYACPNGTRCTAGEDSEACSAAECKPLLCVGTGEGDADAYCTNVDCTEDAHCGPGMYCGILRSSTQICGTNKGEDTPCLDPANFGDNASTFQEGPLTLLRNVCLKREPCAPCASGVDCSLIDNGECVNLGGENVCAKTCGDDDDCPNDFACTGGFCTPGSGTCTPPKENNFCYSCLNDLQCGDATNSVACELVSGNQKACFDFSFPDDCTTDNDCPEAPSGRNGECLDEDEGLSPTDDVYHKCYFPFFTTSSSFQCWPD